MSPTGRPEGEHAPERVSAEGPSRSGLPTSRDVRFGLDAADAYALVPGASAVATAGRQAAWYFRDEQVAIPRDSGAGFAAERRPMHDLRLWSAANAFAPRERPPLVWVGAPDLVRAARLAPDARTMTVAGASHPIRFVEQLPTNSAWFDARSAAFFAGQDVLLRGHGDGDAFVVHGLWPQAWRLPVAAAPALALPAALSPGAALLASMRERAAETLAFDARALWERAPGATWAGKAVVAFIVNGAQGDDDEAHGGHFSIATGRVGDDGEIASWVVNSIYALDLVSEKGILPAPVPLDRYMGDLNSGQAWYRPSWALCALLDDDRAAWRVQSALGRVFRHFWRGQLPYYHPTDNCTSIAIDALRAIGLPVPAAGPTARWRAWAALPWIAARERSLAKGKTTFDYLVTERTRLLPPVALAAVFDVLWTLAHRRAPPDDAPLAREMTEDMVALAWLTLPQFPSSRAWGAAPALSLDEYRARVPEDPARRQIIPLPPRALPEDLRDDDLLPPLPHPSDLAVRWLAVAPLALVALVLALGS